VIKLTRDISQDSLKKFIETSKIIQVCEQYSAFQDKTRSGLHGNTAPFYQQYIELVNIYKFFSRAYRTGNLEMYMVVLDMMIPAFFFNRQEAKLRTMDDGVPPETFKHRIRIT